MLIDEFGDGWDGLWLYINHSGYVSSSYRPAHPDPHPNPDDEGVYFSSSTHAPTYGSNPLLFTVCGSLHQDRFRDRGHYTLEIKHDSSARNNWEILWQVSTLTKDYNDWVYGDHKTRVEYVFGDDGLFHLEKVDRPLAHPEHCSRCTPPPPPPSPVDHNAGAEVSDPESPTSAPAPQPPPVHPVPFELGDSEGDGWFSDWRGAKYSISDKSKTKLLDSGSICGPVFKEPCQAKLPDGDYYFRVGGAGDDTRDEMSWKFCGKEGKAMQELSFAVIHGKCVPGHLSDAIDMIGAEEQTMVTLRGEVLLENVFTSDLSTSEARIFETVIAQELGVDSEEVMVISVCQTRPGVYCSEDGDDDDDGNGGGPRGGSRSPKSGPRSLSETFVLDVVFLVTMVAEKYDKVGSHYHAMQDLVSGLGNLFDSSLKSGQLQSNLRSAEQESLSYVRLKHFVPLKHTDLSYRFVSLTNAPTALPHSDHLTVEHIVVDESLEQAALLVTPVLLVGIALLVIALVVLRERWAKRVEELSLSPERDLPLRHSPTKAAVAPPQDNEDEELSFELRSDLSVIPSHNSSRSRYRPKEGSSLSHDDSIHLSNFSRTVSNPRLSLPLTPSLQARSSEEDLRGAAEESGGGDGDGALSRRELSSPV
jgi:hypothetical protein